MVLNGDHGWLWAEGTATRLRTLPDHGPETWGSAVNDRGDVVGWSGNDVEARGPVKANAVIWTGGNVVDLGPFPTVSNWNVALNEHGEAIAASRGGPILWRAGRRIDLGRTALSLRRRTSACEGVALNDRGVAVGMIRPLVPGPDGMGAPEYGLVWQRARR